MSAPTKTSLEGYEASDGKWSLCGSTFQEGKMEQKKKKGEDVG